MKKILLVSVLQSVTHLLRTAEPELNNKTVTYIPTACNADKLKFIYKLRKWSFKSMGLALDELDISTSSYEVIQTKLAKNDIIFVAGGITFYLLQEMKRTGADKLIIDEVNKGKLYIGESAGAIITAPDIEYSSAMDSPKAAPDLKEYSGLGLVDFYIVPHAQNRAFDKAVKQIVNTYSSTLDLRVIRDNQAILIKDHDVEIL